MKILGIDTSALVATVALCEDEKPLAVYSQKCGLTHSQTMLPMVKNVLDNTDTSIDDIDMIAVSEGPGSFTGIRIGISTVKGLAFGKNKICIGVSTLEAMARTVAEFCTDAIICPVMDARRNQLYNALFLCESGKLTRICEDRLVSVFDLEEELKKYSDKKIYLCGDGYDIAKNAFTTVKTENTPLISQYQSAYSVALGALEIAKQELLTTDIELSPVYLRASQAERERLEKLEAGKKKEV